ncbi:MAG: tetratricopeptide repeat protein [Verrucomicrobiota bacterium]
MTVEILARAAARQSQTAAAVIALLFATTVGGAQEIRRAQPVTETPIPRALPADDTPSKTVPADDPGTRAEKPEQPSDKRQLDYSNALFSRKMYDLAIPEYEKYLSDYAGASGRPNAYFGLGESYRALGKNGQAKANFQKVLDEAGDGEFAGPSAYALAVMAFSQRDFTVAQSLFHKAAAKTKDASVALSARYFEGRCLESLKRVDEALALYLQVADVPSQYRDDARTTAGTLLLARGKRSEALKQFEFLANESDKPNLKAEAAVRAGLVAADLAITDRGKIDKDAAEKARTLLQRGRTAVEAGRWRGIAQAAYLRLEYQTGQLATLVNDYKKGADQLPEEARPEIQLLVGNAQRQLGRNQDAEQTYRQLIEKYPTRDETREARYQRLVNLYTVNPDAVLSEVDRFLQTNPPAERAAEARLLKAEALYKRSKFTEAAPLYEELRASALAPKLRAEASYKLGWCYVQSKETPRVIEAFSYFLKAFPDDPQAAVALTQRALAYEQDKNAAAAIDDLSTLLAKYPAAKEREGALQQKALLLAELKRDAEMAQTFQQLLKEYPKSAAAAQANYYSGKVAFDAKDYKRALSSLDNARRLNRAQYFELATLRMILAQYYLHDRAGAVKEVDAYLAANAKTSLPAEVLEWLGVEFYNEKNYAQATKYLKQLGQLENSSSVKPDYWFYLGDAASRLQDFDAAETAYSRYLQTSTDPAGKAKVLLALGATKVAAHKTDDAEKIATEIMTLQPEGKVNAEARLLAGDVQFARERWDEAGKAYAGVALLYDDPAITPRALDKAADAYRRAGKTEEADRVAKQLRERFPNYAGG